MHSEGRCGAIDGRLDVSSRGTLCPRLQSTRRQGIARVAGQPGLSFLGSGRDGTGSRDRQQAALAGGGCLYSLHLTDVVKSRDGRERGHPSRGEEARFVLLIRELGGGEFIWLPGRNHGNTYLYARVGMEAALNVWEQSH